MLNALLNVRMMQTNSLVHPTEAEEMRTAIHVKAGEREREREREGGGGGGGGEIEMDVSFRKEAILFARRVQPSLGRVDPLHGLSHTQVF